MNRQQRRKAARVGSKCQAPSALPVIADQSVQAAIDRNHDRDMLALSAFGPTMKLCASLAMSGSPDDRERAKQQALIAASMVAQAFAGPYAGELFNEMYLERLGGREIEYAGKPMLLVAVEAQQLSTGASWESAAVDVLGRMQKLLPSGLTVDYLLPGQSSQHIATLTTLRDRLKNYKRKLENRTGSRPPTAALQMYETLRSMIQMFPADRLDSFVERALHFAVIQLKAHGDRKV